jgi:hypothetical protein
VEVKLAKRWKNHPAGKVLTVSRRIRGELERLGVLEAETKARKKPTRHKMVTAAPASKRKAKK